jgi:hypothetical protein
MSAVTGGMGCMTPFALVRGDATSPQDKGPKVIAHICNDRGGWARASSWQSPSVGRYPRPHTGPRTAGAPATN